MHVFSPVSIVMIVVMVLIVLMMMMMTMMIVMKKNAQVRGVTLVQVWSADQ